MAGQSESKSCLISRTEKLYREVAEELRLFRQLLIDAFALKNSQVGHSQPDTVFVARTRDKTADLGVVPDHEQDGHTSSGPGGAGGRLPLQIVCQSCGSGGVVCETTTPECGPDRDPHPCEERRVEVVNRQVFVPEKPAVPVNVPNHQADEVDLDEEKNAATKRKQGHSYDLKDKYGRYDLTSPEDVPYHEQKPRSGDSWCSITESISGNSRSKEVSSTTVADSSRSRKRSGCHSHSRSRSQGGEKHTCRRRDTGITDRNRKQNVADKVYQNLIGEVSTNGQPTKHSHSKMCFLENKPKTDNARLEKIHINPKEVRRHTRKSHGDRKISPHRHRRHTFGGRSRSSRFSGQRRKAQNINSNNTATEDIKRHVDHITTLKAKTVMDRPRASPPSDSRSRSVSGCQTKPTACFPPRYPPPVRRCLSNNFPKGEDQRESSTKEKQTNEGKNVSDLSKDVRNKGQNCHIANYCREAESAQGHNSTCKAKPSAEKAKHVNTSIPVDKARPREVSSDPVWDFIQVPQSLSLVDLRLTEKMDVRGSHSFCEGMAENNSLDLLSAHLWCENRQLGDEKANDGNREHAFMWPFGGPFATRNLAKIHSCAAKLRHYYRVLMRPHIIDFLTAPLAYVRLPSFMFKPNASIYRYVSLLAIPSCYMSDPRILFLDPGKYLRALGPFTEKKGLIQNSKSKVNADCNGLLKELLPGSEAWGFSVNDIESKIKTEPGNISSEIRINKQNVLDKIEELCYTTPPLSPIADPFASEGMHQCTDPFASEGMHQCTDPFASEGMHQCTDPFASEGMHQCTDSFASEAMHRCTFLRVLMEDADLFENVLSYVYRSQTHERIKKIFIDNQRLDSTMQDDASSDLALNIDRKNLLDKPRITKQEEVKNSHGRRCQIDETSFPHSSSGNVLKSFADIKVNLNNSSDEKNESVPGVAKETTPTSPGACEQDYEIIDFSYEYDMLNSPIVLNASDRVYHIRDIANENTEDDVDEESSTDDSTILGQLRNSEDILATAMDSAGLSESAVENFLNADFDLDSIIFDQNVVNHPSDSQDADAFLDQIFAGFSSLEDTSGDKDTAPDLIQTNTGDQAEGYTSFPSHTHDDHKNGVSVRPEMYQGNEGWESRNPWMTDTGKTEIKPPSIERENVPQGHGGNKNYASDFLSETHSNDHKQECRDYCQCPPASNSVIQEALRNTNKAFHFDSYADVALETKVHTSSPTDPAVTLRGDEGAALVCTENNTVTDEALFVSKFNDNNAKKSSKKQSRTIIARQLDYGCDKETPGRALAVPSSRRRVQTQTQQPEALPQSCSTAKPKSPDTGTAKAVRAESLDGASQAGNCNMLSAPAPRYRGRPHMMLKRRLRSNSARNCHSTSQTLSALLSTCNPKSAKTTIHNSNNNADIMDSSSSDLSDDQFACSSSTTAATSSSTTAPTEDVRQKKLSQTLKQRCKELEKHYRKRYQNPSASTFPSSLTLTTTPKIRSKNSKRMDDKNGIQNISSSISESLQSGASRGTRLKSSVINFVRRIQGGYGDQFPISTRTTREKRHDLCNKYLEYHGITPADEPDVKPKKRYERKSFHEPNAQDTADINSNSIKARKTESEPEKEHVREPLPADERGPDDPTQCSSSTSITPSATSLSSCSEDVKGSKNGGHIQSNAPCHSEAKKKTDDKNLNLWETALRDGATPSFSSSRPSTPELVSRLEAIPMSPAYRLMKKIEQFELDFQTRFPATIAATSSKTGGASAATATTNPMRPKAKRSNAKRSKKPQSKANKRKEIQYLLQKFESLDVDPNSPRIPSSSDSGRETGAREKLELPPIPNVHGYVPRTANQGKSVCDSPELPTSTRHDAPQMTASGGHSDPSTADFLRDKEAKDSDESGNDTNETAGSGTLNKRCPPTDPSSEVSLDEESNENYSGCHHLNPNTLSATGKNSTAPEVNKDGQPWKIQANSCLPKLEMRSLSALTATSYPDGQSDDLELSWNDETVIADTRNEKKKQAPCSTTQDDSPRESSSGCCPPKNAQDNKSCIDTEPFDSLEELWASYERLIKSDNEACANGTNGCTVSSTVTPTTQNHTLEKNATAADSDSMTKSVTAKEDDSAAALSGDLLDHGFLDSFLSQESAGFDLDLDCDVSQSMTKSPQTRASRCPWPSNIKGTSLSPIMEDPNEEMDAV